MCSSGDVSSDVMWGWSVSALVSWWRLVSRLSPGDIMVRCDTSALFMMDQIQLETVEI